MNSIISNETAVSFRPNLFWPHWFVLICTLCTGCAVTPSIQHQYTLLPQISTSAHRTKTHKQATILITRSEALAGYRTEQMWYMKNPYELNAFAQNGWAAPPAELLMPLMIQSLEASNRFKAVVSSNTPEPSDYQLDTQLINLYQNFLTRPSQMEFTVKIVLSDLKKNRIIASQLIQKHVKCPMDTPYGGVIAANQAAKQFTEEMAQFVLNRL